MKASELRKILENSYAVRYPDREYRDEEVVVLLNSPSIGSRACVGVEYATFGFDWESGKLLIKPNKPVVLKSEKQELWDMAHDFIYMLSKEVTPKGNPTSLAKHALAIIERAKDKK